MIFMFGTKLRIVFDFCVRLNNVYLAGRKPTYDSESVYTRYFLSFNHLTSKLNHLILDLETIFVVLA